MRKGEEAGNSGRYGGSGVNADRQNSGVGEGELDGRERKKVELRRRQRRVGCVEVNVGNRHSDGALTGL
jgi:hypothetical protein